MTDPAADRCNPDAARRPVGRRPAVAAGVGLAVLAAAAAWYGWGRRAGPVEVPPPNPGATAPGVTAGEVVFGMTGPLAGPSREIGLGVRAGVEVAFRAVNDGGGVHGRHLRLDARDDGYDPDRAAANAADLLDRAGVFGLVGCVGTPTAERTAPLAAGVRRVFFAPYSGARFLRRVPPDRFVFNYRAGYDEETAVIVRHLLSGRRVEPDRVAVFSQNDAYGDAGFAGVERALKKAGYDPQAALHVRYDRATGDVEPAVREVLARRDGVKAVVMVATYGPAAAFIRRLKDEGVDAVFTNVSFVGGTALAAALKGYGPAYPAGVIVTQVVPHPQSDAAAVTRYRTLLAKYHPGEEPGFASLEGYLAGTVLAKGVANAGPGLTGDGLVGGLEAIHDFDLGVGTPVRYSPADHQASHAVWGTVLDADGRFQELYLY
jgi:ABC-type branched-subunit amino acid transport system substrate-binding protein